LTELNKNAARFIDYNQRTVQDTSMNKHYHTIYHIPHSSPSTMWPNTTK